MRRVDIRMTADPEKTSAFHEAPAAAGTTLPVSAVWRATLDAAVAEALASDPAENVMPYGDGNAASTIIYILLRGRVTGLTGVMPDKG